MTLPKSRLQLLLVTVAVVSGISLIFCKPISQDAGFHQFADTRTICLIDNCWNVISNLAFVFVGLMGLHQLKRQQLVLVPAIKAAYAIFFTGILMVAFGSAWYHYRPNNTTLVWDRLPMTIAFMSLLSIALAEFVSVRAGRNGLVPFLVVGIFSIGWWQYGELHQRGDLRLYALVQYLPVLLILLLLLFGQPIFNSKWGYVSLFGAYVLAKLAEHFDAGIYQLTNGFMAGHCLKHLLTAVGLWMFLLYVGNRTRVSDQAM